MKILFKCTLVLLAILLCGGGWLAYETCQFLYTPPAKDGEDINFDVPPGATMTQIAKDLAARGLVTDARKFAWYARYKKMDNRLQAGRFQLNNGWRPEQILDALANGQPILYRVTVPEGLTWWQTGKLLEDEGFLRFGDFQQIIMDPVFLRHYGIPFTTAEGFLMPDTYLLKKPDAPKPDDPPAGEEDSEENAKAREQWQAQARSVAGRLVDNFWRKTAPLWPASQGKGTSATGDSKDKGGISLPAAADLKKWVILASIVEKETGVPHERGRVAGVYDNRLKKNMLLQADPTVIYGLGTAFSGSLKRADLSNPQNPYNTYQHPGLPPGPIASFGAAALKAAIRPERHEYLYFVAEGDGTGHVFSRTYEEHEQAVRDYRRQKGSR